MLPISSSGDIGVNIIVIREVSFFFNRSMEMLFNVFMQAFVCFTTNLAIHISTIFRYYRVKLAICITRFAISHVDVVFFMAFKDQQAYGTSYIFVGYMMGVTDICRISPICQKGIHTIQIFFPICAITCAVSRDSLYMRRNIRFRFISARSYVF